MSARTYATLADVAQIVRETHWLIRGWLPRGYVTVVFGHPSAGKSGLVLQTARQLVFGEPWPDGEQAEKIERVVWMDTEAAHGMLVERASLWGVPADQIIMCGPPDDPLRECQLDNRADLALLHEAVRDNNAELVVIDSLRGAHSKKEDDQANSMFHALQILARDTGAAVVLVHHPRKPDPKALTDQLSLEDLRGTGTLGASARIVWAVEAQAQTEAAYGSRVRVIKSNLDSRPAAIGFTISDLGFQWGELPKPSLEELGAVETACAFLKRVLQGGAVPSDEVDSRRRVEGITERNLKAARRKLGVKAIHEAKARGRWFMKLSSALETRTPLTAFEPEPKKVKEDQEVVEEEETVCH